MTSSRLVPTLFALALAVTASPAPPLQAQSPAAETRTVYVTVTDSKGAAVPGLAAADFVVKEDGRTRPVVGAAPTAVPLTVALMVDDNGVGLQSMRQGAAAFADRLRGLGRIGIFTTSGRTLKIQDYTDSPASLVAAINKIYTSGTPGAFLVDGFVDVASDFTKREVKRPVIVSVGVETEDFSQAQPGDAITALMRARAQLYLVRLGRPIIGQGNAMAAERGESLADEQARFNAVIGQAPGRTGGRVEQLAAHTGIPHAMVAVANDLANQVRSHICRGKSGGQGRSARGHIAPARTQGACPEPHRDVPVDRCRSI